MGEGQRLLKHSLHQRNRAINTSAVKNSTKQYAVKHLEFFFKVIVNVQLFGRNIKILHVIYRYQSLLKGRSSENRLQVTFCKGHLHLKRKSPFVLVSPAMYQEEEDDSKLQENLLSEGGMHLNLHHNLVFVYPVLLGDNPPTPHPTPNLPSPPMASLPQHLPFIFS